MIESLIAAKKNTRKKNDNNDKLSLQDTFVVSGIHDLTQLFTLNPVFVDISSSLSFLDFISKYPANNYIYRLRVISVTLLASMENTGSEILVTCTGLNDSKKADANGIQANILAIIHTENIPSCEQLINIDVVDYFDTREAANLPFCVLTDSIHGILKFYIELKNHNRELIKLKEDEQKITQFTFSIDVIKG